MIPALIAAIVFFIASFNLFQNQIKRSQLISKGAIALPAAGQCGVPFYDTVNRSAISRPAPKLRMTGKSDTAKAEITSFEIQIN